MKIKFCLVGKPYPICFSLVLLPLLLASGTAFGGNPGANTLTPITNAVVCPGDSAIFSTVASGPLPYRFEWWKNGVVIAGQTNNSLTLSNITSTNAATYSVKLTGGANSATNSATLTVRTNVSATPMSDLVRFAGSTAIFTTTASGTGPFSYVWRFNGTVLTGRTNSSLILTNVSLGDAGTYSVIVSGACKSVTNSANLMVDTCFPAVDVMLVIDRSGSMLGQKYTDARQACSNFVQNLHFGTNADQAGLASYNSTATLNQTLTNNAPVLNQAIQSLPAATGNTSISAGLQTGQTELTSVRHHAQALPVMVLLSDGLPTGSDSPSNALYTATQAKNAGTRIFTVGLGSDVDPVLMSGIASSPGDYFSTTNSSQLAALFDAISTVICRPPTNIIGPSNFTACAGSTAVFSVAASGCSSFSYQWEKDGIRIIGQTNNSLVLTNVSASSAGVYAVEVTSVCRSVTNSATLTVTPAPSINCTANKTVEAGADWSFDAPTANYPITVLTTVTNSTGPCTFTATRTWQTKDACQNSAQCSQQVTVVDTTVPVMVCSSNLVLSANTGHCSRSNVTFVVTASDNCGSPTVVSIPPSGSTFPVGVTVVTNTATDSHGNSSVCTFTVTITDTQNPVISCPANLVLSADAGQCTRSNVTFSATANDNCGSASVVSVPPSGSTFPIGVTVVTNTATDSHGNTSTCAFTVTINDTEKPQISCPENLALSADAGQCSRSNVTFLVTATDNCGSASVVSVPASGSTFPVGVTVVTNTATDSHGNTSVCTFTVTINETELPVITCPENLNLSADSGHCSRSNVTFTVTANDNCGSVSVVSTPPSGSTFPIGTTSVTNTATDSHGNSSTCTFTVTITDTQNPVISCPANLALSANPGQCGRSNVTFVVTANDNCGSVTVVSVPVSGSTFPIGVTVVTNTATDSHGHTSVCTFTVTINDTEPPSIACVANKTVEVGSAWTFDEPAISDNCGSPSVTISTTTNAACGQSFIATRTWTAVDSSGNSASCSQTVNVVDTTAPTVVITSPTNGTVFIAPARIAIVVEAHDTNGSITLVEFFSGATKVGQSAGSGPTYLIVLTNVPAGNYTLTAKATDSCGNTATSAPVNISVLNSLPLTVNGPIRLNFQTGFYEQIARITNPTPFTLSALGVLAYNLPAGWRVQNASFISNGVPGVLYNQPLAPGASANVTLKYFLGAGASTNAQPTLVAIEMSAGATTSASGTPVPIIRQLVLADGSFLINFPTVNGATYFVLYSDDMVTWKTSAAPVHGTGFTVQWIDYGPPATDSLPSTHSSRFYRVVSVP